MANVLQELQGLLTQPKNFFPPLHLLPKVDGSALPLLDLVNDATVSTPQLPLTLAGIERLLPTLGTGELDALLGDLRNAFGGGDPLSGLKAIVNVPHSLESIFESDIKPLFINQLMIGASLLTIVSALDPFNHKNLFNSIGAAEKQYFFAGGYTTVAGEKISPPELGSPAQPQSFFSKKTGKQYIRDLTRVGFEAVANEIWVLTGRYATIDTNAGIKAAAKGKAKAWFKGFADFAEATVTSAVEQVLQGGGPAHGNALLAAAVATAAGTAARKSAQHVYLEEIGIALPGL